MRDNLDMIAAVGIGCLTTLALVFIVLKLTGVIAWSWWLVLIPLFVAVAAGLAVAVLFAICGFMLLGVIGSLFIHRR